MATFLFDEHVFGPIKSRRLGSSLGINLLSTTQKVCNFNCIYCECGLTHKLVKGDHAFVDKTFFLVLLKDKLERCVAENTPIDAITFAGNGEPTLHPQFLSIVNEIIELRNKYFPKAIIAVLTNGYTLHKKRVAEGLSKVDKAIIKLDAGNDEMLNLIDQPKGHVPLNKFVQHLKQFKGKLIIQTMFLKGVMNGKPFDNSTGNPLEDWFKLIHSIKPNEVMLYSLDRDTPIESLERIPMSRLQTIAAEVEKMNIKTNVV